MRISRRAAISIFLQNRRSSFVHGFEGTVPAPQLSGSYCPAQATSIRVLCTGFEGTVPAPQLPGSYCPAKATSMARGPHFF